MDPALWRKCHEEMVMNSANIKFWLLKELVMIFYLRIRDLR